MVTTLFPPMTRHVAFVLNIKIPSFSISRLKILSCQKCKQIPAVARRLFSQNRTSHNILSFQAISQLWWCKLLWGSLYYCPACQSQTGHFNEVDLSHRYRWLLLLLLLLSQFTVIFCICQLPTNKTKQKLNKMHFWRQSRIMKQKSTRELNLSQISVGYRPDKV